MDPEMAEPPRVVYELFAGRQPWACPVAGWAMDVCGAYVLFIRITDTHRAVALAYREAFFSLRSRPTLDHPR